MTLLNKTDETVMSLLHYFITEKGYNPIILQGVQNEIWLENLTSDYKIVRIVSNYIHNKEQLDYDLFKSTRIIKQIKHKTFSFKLNTLSIFVNLGDNISNENIKNTNEIECASIKEIEDLSKYDNILKIFPNIVKKTHFKEEGVELFVKITDDINKANEKNNKRAEEIFALRKPFVTYGIIIINILVFLAMVLISREGVMAFSSETLVKFGGNLKYLVLEGEFFRILTSAFLHDGIMHLFFNMYALYVIGPQLENFFGKTRFALIYIISAICASLLSLAFNDAYTVSVGASGAIFGLFGSLLYFGYYYRVYLGSLLRSQIIPVILLNLALGFMMTGIDNAAHIGGLVGGVLISMGLGVKYKSTKSDMINGMIISILYIAFLIYLVFFR